MLLTSHLCLRHLSIEVLKTKKQVCPSVDSLCYCVTVLHCCSCVTSQCYRPMEHHMIMRFNAVCLLLSSMGRLRLLRF